RTADLDETLDLLSDGSEQHYDHTSAWFDAISTGSRLGRGAFGRGSLATLDQLPRRLRRDPLRFDAPHLPSVPDVFPSGALNKLSLATIGELYYRTTPERGRGAVQNITSFYHMLDLVGHWNRGYGSRGFLQYQFSTPPQAHEDLRRIIGTVARSGHYSALNVLKTMGPGNRA